jgi:hypothetical protein
VIEPGVLEVFENLVGAHFEHGMPVAASNVPERMGKASLTDADRTDDGDVRMLPARPRGRAFHRAYRPRGQR